MKTNDRNINRTIALTPETLNRFTRAIDRSYDQRLTNGEEIVHVGVLLTSRHVSAADTGIKQDEFFFSTAGVVPSVQQPDDYIVFYSHNSKGSEHAILPHEQLVDAFRAEGFDAFYSEQFKVVTVFFSDISSAPAAAASHAPELLAA